MKYNYDLNLEAMDDSELIDRIKLASYENDSHAYLFKIDLLRELTDRHFEEVDKWENESGNIEDLQEYIENEK